MYNQKDVMLELVTYLKKNLKKGYTEESLRWALIEQGYSKLQVEKAIKRTNQELASEAPILKTRPVIEHKIIRIDEPEKERRWFKLRRK